MVSLQQTTQQPINTTPESLATQSLALELAAQEVKPASWFMNKVNQLCRTLFLQRFVQLQKGYICLTDPVGTVEIGDPQSTLRCDIHIHDLRAYRVMISEGSNGAAEAYIQGLWQCDDLTRLIQILLQNRRTLDSLEGGMARVSQLLLKFWHAGNKNSKAGSRRNIAEHYDLGNDFFRLWLDERLMYSSALFNHPDETLETASDNKLQRICDVLELSTEDKVLEIGSGWGGFACYAAKHTGCQVTTITISQEQFNAARERAVKEGVADKVEVKLLDYRDLEGQYDKVVSIEMIEAVGHHYLNNYFQTIHDVLKPGGKALIQAITLEDHRYETSLKTVDYIKRYIFPGSFIPCYSVIASTAGNNKLILENLFDMGLSYAQTLRHWRQRYYQNSQQIQALHFDARFMRMWEFYLCYCEGGFREQAISVGQLLFRKSAL